MNIIYFFLDKINILAIILYKRLQWSSGEFKEYDYGLVRLANMDVKNVFFQVH